MKPHYFSFLLLLLYCSGVHAQQIYFQDPFLKQRLLEPIGEWPVAYGFDDQPLYVDANDDGEIEVPEALAVKTLNLTGDPDDPAVGTISSLDGLQFFANLTALNCQRNAITFIDATPFSNLKFLICSENPLSFLDVSGLAPLERLSARFCTLPSLGSIQYAGANNIRQLELDGNPFTTVNVSNMHNLSYFSLTHSNLTTVNLTGLDQLERLDLNNNSLLTSVDLTTVSNLKWLYAHQSAFTGFDVSQNPLLESFFANSNQLTGLDLSHNTHLQRFDLSDNALTTLNIKNSADEGQFMDVSNNPDLAYICADEFQIADTRLFSNPLTEVNSYCSFSPGGTYYTISGVATFDADDNGCDASDLSIPNVRLQVFDGVTSQTVVCNASGQYNLNLPAGNFSMTPVLENQDYFSFSPPAASFSFTAGAAPLTQNFCIVPDGSHPDLEIAVLALNPSIPGIYIALKISYKNKGNMVQSGNIVFTFDEAICDSVSSNPSAASQAPGQLTWNFNNLAPFERREIDLVFHLNAPTDVPALNAGQLLNFTGQILADSDDETPADNTFTLVQTAVNSYDPNDKTCLEGQTITPEMVGQYVHYMIRFENNGTANAQNIVVKDIIDTTKFDANSIIPIGGSHEFTARMNGGKIEFIFENINLPFDDANNDGYVVFKIKTKPTLAAGDSFSNTANIYFDYNFPIVTNTATTFVEELLQSAAFDAVDEISLLPNPARDHFALQTKDDVVVKNLQIYNLQGQLLQVIAYPENPQNIDVSAFATGQYLIRMATDRGISVKKFLKE